MATARTVALEAIRRVTEEDAYSTLVLRALLERSNLDERDRALATELTYGALRRLLTLDWTIERRANRPIGRMSPRARAVLRLGAYQLRYTRTPDHAAVSESVALASARERGFVNAVLRRLAADPPALPSTASDEDVAVRTGLAPWAVAELRRLLGADVEPAAQGLAGRGRVCLRTNTCRIGIDEFEAALISSGHEPARIGVESTCLLIEGGDPARLPGFDDGWFAVQDAASAFVVRALDPQPGDRVIDVCAGPGGKSAHIACLVEPKGFVVAGDVHPRRAALISRLAARLGVRPRVLAQDALRPAVRPPFDRVLVDAPCSGIGAARRRPELLWRPRKDDLSGLARAQVRIGAAAAELLRPGGRLVYSACTFPRAETDAACDALVRHRPELEPAEIGGPDGVDTRVRLWPHRHGCDGMFIAAFRKRP